MFLTKRPGGVYHVVYHDELGRRRSVSTNQRRKAEAQKFLQTFRAEDRERRSKLKRLSLQEFTNSFLGHSRNIHTPKTVEGNATALTQFQRIIGDVPLHKVGVREIETFLATKRQEASVWTARKYFLALAAAFETARRWGHITRNPFRSVQKPKVPELLPVFLSRAEFRTLMGLTPDREQRELVFCAVSTGMRLGELLALRWPQVDIVRRVITVANTSEFTTKSKKARAIPMTEALWKLLVERKARLLSECDLVFHMGGKSLNPDRVSKSFKASVRAAKLSEQVHFHTLRHTFASWLAQERSKSLRHSAPPGAF